jgi:hypothetical protein
MHGSPFVLLLAFDDLTFLWRLLLTAAVVYLAIYVRRQLPHAVERQCSKVQHKTIEALATAVNAKDKLTFDHVLPDLDVSPVVRTWSCRRYRRGLYCTTLGKSACRTQF